MLYIILGFDLGGVLIDRFKNDQNDKLFLSENFLEAFEVQGAIDSIAKLVSLFGEENVYELFVLVV